MPVCLYTRTLTNKRLARHVLKELAFRDQELIIIIADDLHAISMMNRGYNEIQALHRARVFGGNLLRMYEELSREQHAELRVTVGVWEQLATSKEFLDVLSRLNQKIKEEEVLEIVIARFTSFHLRKSGGGVDKVAVLRERSYIQQEIAASICLTEVFGYSDEIWEDRLSTSEPDPLGFLYAERPDIVEFLVGGKELRRRQLFLTDLVTNLK